MNILEQKIKQKIKQKGFIWVDEFFEMAMFDEENGYYKTQNPIGKQGDFITAPEISQIFGEVIACFFYHQLSSNNIKNYQILEIGAGKGTLLKDILHTLKKLGSIPQRAFILDVNKCLIEQQKEGLKNYDITWIKDFSELDNLPTVIITNELFDVFPVKQFICKNKNLYQRAIRLNKNEDFEFFFTEEKHDNSEDKFADELMKDDDWLEISNQSIAFMQQIAKIIKENKGLFITFDYGYWDLIKINTLQSLYNHKFNNVFENIGKADLTYLIDFKQLYLVAKQINFEKIFFQTQGGFLISMGIEKRLENLVKNLPSGHADALKMGVDRLIAKTQMGELFKCLIIENYCQ